MNEGFPQGGRLGPLVPDDLIANMNGVGHRGLENLRGGVSSLLHELLGVGRVDEGFHSGGWERAPAPEGIKTARRGGSSVVADDFLAGVEHEERRAPRLNVLKSAVDCPLHVEIDGGFHRQRLGDSLRPQRVEPGGHPMKEKACRDF